MEKIKETKKNEWFRNAFLVSFGFCENKSISEKQADVFKKYLKENSNNYKNTNAYYYYGIISGKKIKLQESSVFDGSTKGHKTLYRYDYSLTIKPDNTDAENHIKNEIKKLNEKFNELCKQNASDDVLDEIENKIDSLYGELHRIKF